VIEIKKTVEINKSSPKSFGIVFSIVFLIIAIYLLINSENFRILALIVSTIYLLLAFALPKMLILPNKLWFRLDNMIKIKEIAKSCNVCG
jgi:multidrug efflux pump subunit AcrB